MAIPSNELVCQAWIKSIPDFNVYVASQLPSDETVWTDTGAVIVNVVGGTPNASLNIRMPVIQVDCWQNIANSNKLPWNAAMRLADTIRNATYDDENVSRLLTIAENDVDYGTAWAQQIWLMSEPRRVYSDQGDYAGAQFELLVDWTRSGNS